jgi:hypothetical protein
VRESREEAAAVLAAYADLLAGRIRPEALLRSLHVTARQGMGAMQLLGAFGHGAGGSDPVQVQR